ncbi:MAG: MaoC/PaaZ C-terminal domain-containing protein, partial [Bacteroidales bacterium]|nr:MaoC/PaaZ C-terminal domain-containing protein [Bacteroidales bacterium]
ESSLDFQWIHIDTVRAQKESPYKSTIAHGYFNISILPYLWDQIVEVKNLKMSVNYGIERLRFMEPVLVNSRIRIRAKLVDLVNLRGITKANLHVKLEIEGSKKPALEGVIIFLYHFINS